MTLLQQVDEQRGVLFIDEIHPTPRAIEEVLYSVMEDFEVIGNS